MIREDRRKPGIKGLSRTEILEPWTKFASLRYVVTTLNEFAEKGRRRFNARKDGKVGLMKDCLL